MDYQLLDTVKGIIESFCSDDVIFTSLDVSNEVKFFIPQAIHKDVATVVRQLFADGFMERLGYDATLMDVEILGGLKAKTNVYFSEERMPEYNDKINVIKTKPASTQYGFTKEGNIEKIEKPLISDWEEGRWKKTITINPPIINKTNTPLASELELDVDTMECCCKADGRLEIPTNKVKELMWQHGDMVRIEFYNPIFAIILENDPIADDSNLLIRTTITRDNRLRIPKTAFIKAGLPCNEGAKYIVSFGDSAIEMEKVG